MKAANIIEIFSLFLVATFCERTDKKLTIAPLRARMRIILSFIKSYMLDLLLGSITNLVGFRI
jgi:hypothetical protein